MNIFSRFLLTGLFGERNIEVNFNSNTLILVAENGQGKTTVLNALYALITGDIAKLKKIDFVSMELEFSDGANFSIQKETLTLGLFDGMTSRVSRYISRMGHEKFFELVKLHQLGGSMAVRSSKQFQEILATSRMPLSIVLTTIREYLSEQEENGFGGPKIRETLDAIKEKIGFNVLYLPTYRRVEHDLNFSAETNNGNTNSQLINFGMKDVDAKIKEITKEILSSSVEWFSKVNGQILNQLVDGLKIEQQIIDSIQNPEKVRIVLDRVGNNVSEASKERILKLIKTREIERGHDHLVYFISSLVKVYEKQQENDTALQSFCTACNNYLSDKMLRYDESTVAVDIVRKKNNRSVDIGTLSSGEKQILSLFSKLYLQKHGEIGIFFDEPELSLSIEWQTTLLPDILKSGKCSFLFAVTHSPFIFQNDLKKYAVDLGEFITEL